jgi:hypothetical protein
MSFLDSQFCAIILFEKILTVATMISEVYDAFIAAGAREDKARKAAEALVNSESRFSRIDADRLVLKWMTGTILGGVVTLVIKTVFA